MLKNILLGLGVTVPDGINETVLESSLRAHFKPAIYSEAIKKVAKKFCDALGVESSDNIDTVIASTQTKLTNASTAKNDADAQLALLQGKLDKMIQGARATSVQNKINKYLADNNLTSKVDSNMLLPLLNALANRDILRDLTYNSDEQVDDTQLEELLSTWSVQLATKNSEPPPPTRQPIPHRASNNSTGGNEPPIFKNLNK